MSGRCGVEVGGYAFVGFAGAGLDTVESYRETCKSMAVVNGE